MNISDHEKRCFVVMPISDPTILGYDKGHFREVYDYIIKPACDKAGFIPIRADEVTQSNNIVLDIIRHLIDAEMVVCDLSARNPNCLYELGIRHALKKPVSIIIDDKTEQIFDIKDIREIRYDADLRISRVTSIIESLAKSIKTNYEMRTNHDSNLLHLVEQHTRSSRASKTNHRVIDGVVAPPTNAIAREQLQMCGTVCWDDDSRLWFVQLENETFGIPRRCIAQKNDIQVGGKIFFVPRREVIHGQQRAKATCAFCVGGIVEGIVSYIHPTNKFAFALVRDEYGNNQKVYLPLANASIDLDVDDTVEFTIDENDEGPIGIQLSKMQNRR